MKTANFDIQVVKCAKCNEPVPLIDTYMDKERNIYHVKCKPGKL